MNLLYQFRCNKDRERFRTQDKHVCVQERENTLNCVGFGGANVTAVINTSLSPEVLYQVQSSSSASPANTPWQPQRTTTHACFPVDSSNIRYKLGTHISLQNRIHVPSLFHSKLKRGQKENRSTIILLGFWAVCLLLCHKVSCIT